MWSSQYYLVSDHFAQSIAATFAEQGGRFLLPLAAVAWQSSIHQDSEPQVIQKFYISFSIQSI